MSKHSTHIAAIIHILNAYPIYLQYHSFSVCGLHTSSALAYVFILYFNTQGNCGRGNVQCLRIADYYLNRMARKIYCTQRAPLMGEVYGQSLICTGLDLIWTSEKRKVDFDIALTASVTFVVSQLIIYGKGPIDNSRCCTHSIVTNG